MHAPRLSSLALVVAPLVPPSGGPDPGETDLEAMSLEELLSLEVTTASRKATNLSDTAAAVFVITREDIRRSGHTSIPELLRMVPGMHVARINSSAWAVGSRGANGHFNDKLLVMIDGRSVYTNLFSGVFWDEPDVLLEDVDRIEVIRGPGGAIWGANAVSGVINIITRSAADTHGAYATALAGDEERGTAAYRYGDVYGENFHWRVFAKWFERDATHSLMGGDSPDGWHYRRAGFRADWDKSDRDTFSFQGAWYSGHEREIDPLVMPTPPYDATFKGSFYNDGGHVLAKWDRTLSDDEDLSLQAIRRLGHERRLLHHLRARHPRPRLPPSHRG